MQNTQQRNHLIFERILYQKAFLFSINYLHQGMIRNNPEIHQTELVIYQTLDLVYQLLPMT